MKKKIYLGFIALLALALSASKANAQYNITSHTANNGCGYIYGTISTNVNGYVPNLYMVIQWGDGTEDTSAVDSNTDYYQHTYAAFGTFTVKAIMTYNGADIDSFTEFYNNTQCVAYQLVLFNDLNSNCVYNSGTDYWIYSSPATVQIDSSGVAVDTVTFTGSLNYAETGPIGTIYTYTVLSAPANFTSCGTASISNTVASTYTSSTGYLGFNCTAATFDLTFYGWFSAGIDGAGSHMYVTNNSCEPQSATVALQFDNTKYTYYFNSGGYPATVSGNTVTFDLGILNSYQDAIFYALFNPIGTLGLGDHVTSTWTVYPITGDINPLNNTQTETDSLGLSHDPNGKGVFPEGTIQAGTQLKYSLGFENTGTAAAQNIQILDTLDANLDVNTLAVVSSSHKVNTQIIHNGAQTIVNFDFPNIDLLDSSHHGLCDGMVVYTINAKNGLAQGTKIDNMAGIYFDVNPVVMTNKVENVIGIPANVTPLNNNSQVAIYPNPATGEITISADNKAFNTMDIVNNIGQSILKQSIQSSTTVVNISKLPAGLYYLKLRGDAGTKVQKFEKL